MNILVIDDEPLWQTEIAEKLNAHFPDATITPVTDVDMLAGVLASNQFDLVIKDCMMQGSNGEVNVPWLRAHGVNCLLLVVSGRSDIVAKGISEGADGGCSKPDFYTKFEAELRRLTLIS